MIPQASPPLHFIPLWILFTLPVRACPAAQGIKTGGEEVGTWYNSSCLGNAGLFFSPHTAVILHESTFPRQEHGESKMAALCIGDNMKEIELTKGKVARVSDHRFEYLNQRRWQAYQNEQGGWYAMRSEGTRPFQKNIKMHREIMGVTDPNIQVDHWDGDGLNNIDENLRVATNTQNAFNRGANKNNKSGFKGVSWHKKDNKYQASIQANGINIHLGYFTDPLDAARAYDEAAKKHHGEFAKTNF